MVKSELSHYNICNNIKTKDNYEKQLTPFLFNKIKLKIIKNCLRYNFLKI
jgi:hypothetical protein